MLSVTLLVNSTLLVVKFCKVKSYTQMFNCMGGSVAPMPALFKGHFFFN